MTEKQNDEGLLLLYLSFVKKNNKNLALTLRGIPTHPRLADHSRPALARRGEGQVIFPAWSFWEEGSSFLLGPSSSPSCLVLLGVGEGRIGSSCPEGRRG